MQNKSLVIVKIGGSSDDFQTVHKFITFQPVIEFKGKDAAKFVIKLQPFRKKRRSRLWLPLAIGSFVQKPQPWDL